MKKLLLPAFFAGSILTAGMARAEIVYISNNNDDSITQLTETTPGTFTQSYFEDPGAATLSGPTNMAIDSVTGDLYVSNKHHPDDHGILRDRHAAGHLRHDRHLSARTRLWQQWRSLRGQSRQWRCR